jgi:4,5-DOPA dioxygenase extradiol
MDIPSLFVSHGAPDLAITDLPTSRFLRELGAGLPRPRAIVVASAHWTSASAVLIEGGAAPETIYDFGGFAPELYDIHYGAPGDPALAARIAGLLGAAGLAAQVESRGNDHGVWVPLSLMFPAADIPVVAISVQPRRDGAHHLAVGAALAGLRREGVLIIGSGAATHNLRELMPYVETAQPWSAAFDDWLVGRAEAGDTAALATWQTLAPEARRNHPSAEHYLPLLVAAGAGGGRARVLHRATTWGVLQMTCLAFG